MKCFSEQELQRFVDNECNVAESLIIRSHLGKCSNCADKLAHQTSRTALVKSALDRLLNNDVQIIIPAIETKIPKQPKNRNVVYLSVIAATVLLAIYLLNPFQSLIDNAPNDFYDQHLTTLETDANKPVTDYPLVLIVVSPDGQNTQSTIH